MIIAAAIKDKNGKIWIGKRHCLIIQRKTADTKELPWGYFKGCDQGFIDDQGKYLSREEAAMHAKTCGQIKECKFQKKRLFSEEIIEYKEGDDPDIKL